MRRLHAAVILSVMLAVGCGDDPTEPDPAQVAIDGPAAITGQWLYSDFAGRWLLRCTFVVTVRVTGGSGTWTGGAIRTGSFSVDLSLEDIIDAWGSDRIDGGQQQNMNWNRSWSDAFVSGITLRYEDGTGATRSARHDVDCADPEAS